MSMTPEQEKKLDEMRDSVVRMETAFLDKGGLRDQVADHELRIRTVETRSTENKTSLKTLVTIACSGGGLGAALAKLFENHPK